MAALAIVPSGHAQGLAQTLWPKFHYGNQNPGGKYGEPHTFQGFEWTCPTGSQVTSSAAIGLDGNLYVGNAVGQLWQIDATTGVGNVIFQAGNNIQSSPAVGSDGTIYFGSWDGYVYAVTTAGTQRWAYDVGALVSSSPAVGSDGTIYVGADNGTVYAINSDGSTKWSSPVASSYVETAPALSPDGSTVYVGSWDHKCYALSATTGTLIWSFATGGVVNASPVVAPDGTIYFGSWDGSLYARNPSDGSPKWTFGTGSSINFATPATGPDGTVYVATYAGQVYALNPADGTQVWQSPFNAGAPIRSGLCVDASGTIYFGCDNNNFYALTFWGNEQWEFSTNGAIESSPAVGPGGTVYFGSADGNVYAVPPSGTLAASLWPEFHENNQSTAVAVTYGQTAYDWVTETGTNIASSAAMDPYGRLFFGDSVGQLWMMDPRTGLGSVWFQAGGAIQSSPAIGYDGTIFFGSWDGYIYAINGSQSVMWSYYVGARVSSSARIGPDGSVYFGADNGYVYAFTYGGSLRWQHHVASNYVETAPALSPDGTQLYVGSWDGNVYALGTSDGSTMWTYRTGNVVNSSPVVGPDGTVYIGSWDGNLYALTQSGAAEWTFATNSSINFNTPALGNGGTLYVGTDAGLVYAINSSSGTAVWAQPFNAGSRVRSGLAISPSGVICFGTDGGDIVAVTTAGTLQWDVPTPGPIEASPAIGLGGTVYVGSSGGSMYAVAPAGPSLIPPDSLTLVRGQLVSGDLASLLSTDGNDLVVRNWITLAPAEAPIQVEVTGHTAVLNPAALSLTIVGEASSVGLTQSASLYNFRTRTWTRVDSRIAPTQQQVMSVFPSGNMTDYVDQSTGEVKALITYVQSGPTLTNVWKATLDQVQWTILP